MTAKVLEKILEEISTPAYVFDLDALRQRVGFIQKRLKEQRIGLCYAMKANPFLAGPMEALADRFEVCSPGEFRICEREHIPMERLVVSGVNKEPGDILRIASVSQGRGIFTVESQRHLELLVRCARETNRELKALVRISSGNQFGVDFWQAREILTNPKGCPGIQFLGVQYYSGTQKKLGKVQEELKKLDGWIHSLQKEGAVIRELEYGPGFYVPYFQTEPKEDLEGLLNAFADSVRQMAFSGRITLEMGRFLTADCGSYLTSIVDRKETEGQVYGIVDGGIHHLNYYGQVMAMKLPYVKHIQRGERKGRQEENWTICGSLCTTADVVVRQLPVTGAQPGDVLVFEGAGAYSVMEGMNLFLSRDLPSVWFWSEEEGLRNVRKAQATDILNSCQRQ